MRIVLICLVVLAALASASTHASRADDGGWTKIYDHPAGAPSAIEMFDDHRGLAKIGSAIEETTDGGFTWTATDKTEIGGAPGVTERWITTHNQSPFGFAPHGPSSLRHTTDGGLTWQDVAVSGYGTFLGAWFVGADGWVLATQCLPGDPTDPAAVDPPACIDHRTLLHTANDGASWSALPEPEDSFEPVFARVDGTVAYRLGRLGCRDGTIYSPGCSLARIFRTADGGKTWSDVSTDVAPASGLRDLRFTSPLDGWVGVGVTGHDIPPAYRSRLAHTRDGGQSWSYVEYPGLFSGVFDVTSTHVVTTANSQSIVLYDIATGTWQAAVTDVRPAFQIPTFVTRDEGYAFAAAGTLGTEDGGATWRQIEAPDGLRVTRIDPDVWWGGRDGALYRSVDAGVSWQEIPRPPGADPAASLSVQGSAGDRIWLMAGFWLWRTNDAGRTWRGIDVEPNAAYHLIDADHAWTEACWPADCRHEIRVTEDGGDSWEARALPANISVEAFTTPLEGYGYTTDPSSGRPGVRGNRAVTHDGGVTWQSQPSIVRPPDAKFFGDILLDGTRAFGMDIDLGAPYQFHVLSTQDGGAHWVNELDLDARLGVPHPTAAYGRIWLTMTHFGEGGELLGPPDRVVIYRKDIDPAPVNATASNGEPSRRQSLVAGMTAAVLLLGTPLLIRVAGRKSRATGG